MAHPYCSQILAHLGLVAGMCNALGIGDVMNRATPQNPAMRLVSAGHAVKAMGHYGLGVVNPPLSLVPKITRRLDC